MIPQTLAIALAFGLLALSRKASGAAIGVLVASMLVWPEFLRIPLGLFEASAPRLVALMLIGKALAGGKHRTVAACRIDRIVLIIWGWTILASILAGASFPQVASMIGRGFDTVLIYFVVRFYITSVENVKELARWLVLVAAIMGIIGLVETITTRSPYSGMEVPWLWIAKEDQFRYGFFRAKASTAIHIYFGMAMIVVTGMLWSINRGFPVYRVGRLGILLGIIGTLSTMSSGPWLGIILVFAFGFYRTKPALIRPSLYMLGVMALFLEVASNRHFYNLIDYLALDPHTAWYRTRLIEIAVSRLSEFWLIGVGAQWPHHWGMLLDGRDHIDVVNHFLIVALYGGLPAMFMYLATHYLAISYVITMWKSSEDASLRLVAFSLACVLLALDFSSLSVGLFGPPLLLSHVLLALIVAVTQMRQSPELSPEAPSSAKQ